MPTTGSDSAGESVYVGLDLGTSSLKAVAATATGSIAAAARAGYATSRPVASAAEQDPRDWISALESVLAQLSSTIPADRWRCLSLTAMMPTLVTAATDGKPVGPAITWEDDRAEQQGEALQALAGGGRLYELTGQRVDGRYLLPMFLRASADDPAVAGGAAWLLSAKDYLFTWLTGEPITDPSTAAGFGCYGLATGGWLRDVIGLAESLSGRKLPSLPPVLDSGTFRPLAKSASIRLGIPDGLPVCLGGADSVMGALGLGLSKVGDVAYLAGTSTVILALSDHCLLDPRHRFLVTPLAGIDGFGLEMDILSTGSAIAWLEDLLAANDQARDGVMELAGATEPGEGPVVLPYLALGEQGALWDASLRGAILGLHLGHGASHIARGLVDGILLESRRCLAILEEIGLPTGEVRVTGGAGTHPRFVSDLADATGRVVLAPGDGETRHSALGAAALAASAMDGVSMLSQRDGNFVTRVPDKMRAASYDALSIRQDEALAAVKAYSHAGGPQ